jgi:Asp-tRNA(Asn)/Glu-tRNA(Gln) amidotransferase A subunit family amidase
VTAIDGEITTALERLEAVDTDIEAFVDEPNRRHRLESSPPADGPLHAVAVGVKDLYRVDGLPTKAGSQLPAWVFDGDESMIVTTLKRAGAVVLGKTAMDEFAYCEPPPTKNPHDPRRTPGGSSGGSAAAVAAGICRLAIGSQSLQSVVVPAAYCGVVGYKSTFGRPRFDGVPLAPSIDAVGLLARSVADLRMGASAVIPDWREPVSSARPVAGVPEPWGPRPRAAGAWDALEVHLEVLRDRGFELRPTRVPWTDPEDLRAWGRRVGDLLHAEMAIAHAPWFDRFAHLYRPRTAEAVRGGQAITAERLRECRTARPTLAGQLQEGAARSGIDCWICPSAAGVAPIGYEDTGDGSMTGLWSYAGFPAVSLPVFDGPDGMPLGIQLVAPPGRDELLLEWAAEVESAFVRDRAPTVAADDRGARGVREPRS